MQIVCSTKLLSHEIRGESGERGRHPPPPPGLANLGLLILRRTECNMVFANVNTRSEWEQSSERIGDR